MTTQEIDIAKIHVGHRLRGLDDAKVMQLASSIEEVGLLQPVIVRQDGRAFGLVAGYHRLAAFQKLGRERIPATVLALDDFAAQIAEIDENLIRNELTVLEQGQHLARRKALYEQAHPETKRGTAGAHASNKAQGNAHTNEIISFASDAADALGMSRRSVEQRVKIAADIAPDVQEMIAGHDIADTVTELLKLASEDEDAQREIAREIVEGRAKTVSDGKRAAKKKSQAEARAQAVINAPASAIRKWDGKIVNDSLSVCSVFDLHLPAQSIDMIFTDPPYHDEHLKLYERLAEVADECLKPGAYCMVYAGKMFLPQIMAAFNERLEYVWTYCVWQPDNNSKISKHHLFEIWRPIVCFKKPGKSALVDWQPDGLQGTRSKAHHEWEQQIEPPMKYIEAYTSAGDVVLDPFVGGGTTLAACKKLGRRFLGFDIDADTLAVAHRRLADE